MSYRSARMITGGLCAIASALALQGTHEFQILLGLLLSVGFGLASLILVVSSEVTTAQSDD